MRFAPFVAMLGAQLLAPAAITAQAKEYLYLGNSLGGDISVIAIPSHKVVGTIPATVVGQPSRRRDRLTERRRPLHQPTRRRTM